jgi:hypothetical protein
MNTLQLETDTFLYSYLNRSENDHDVEKLVDDCVNEFGVEYTAKLIIYARDHHFNRNKCLQASSYLIKNLKKESFAKFLFTRRINKQGGLINEVKDIITIINYYHENESKKRNREDVKNIPYPNSMRKGLKSALENFKWSEFVDYYNHNFESGIKLKDVIKYFHPNPKNSIAIEKISLTEYLSHLNDRDKYSKEIDKAIKNSVNDEYEIDIFHAILYDIIKSKDSYNEEEQELFNNGIDFDVENLRSDIQSIIIQPNVF